MGRRARKLSIPTFALYGEAARSPASDLLHIEAIQSRSRLHNWEIAAHTHRGLHQILWVVAGPVAMALDDRKETCRGPVAIIVPPGTVHAFSFSSDTAGQVLTIDPRAIVEGDGPAVGAALRALFRAPCVLRFESCSEPMERLAALVQELAAECASPYGAESPIPLWLARAILWRLADHGIRQARRTEHRDHALFTRFIVLVEAHYREHWPISKYARLLGLTPAGLNRLTRADTGQAALDVLHARLAREASRRLTYTTAPIAKLAYELGFEDPAYFCRFFKRRTGRGPRDYRRTTSTTSQ
ncbi:MAG: helix-turn-helix domain-containing protein [Steroidobacteraceae bacterium]